MKKIVLFLPLVLLLSLVALLIGQLRQPNQLAPSEDWQGKPLPEFRLPTLHDHTRWFEKADLPSEPFILNVWASWCTWCIKEFPMLAALQKQGVKIVGLTYADKSEDARHALSQWGNPFHLILDDYPSGQLTQTLAVNAAPTTYLVDRHGIIRYQQKGFHPDFIEQLLPRWQALQQDVSR